MREGQPQEVNSHKSMLNYAAHPPGLVPGQQLVPC